MEAFSHSGRLISCLLNLILWWERRKAHSLKLITRSPDELSSTLPSACREQIIPASYKNQRLVADAEEVTRSIISSSSTFSPSQMAAACSMTFVFFLEIIFITVMFQRHVLLQESLEMTCDLPTSVSWAADVSRWGSSPWWELASWLRAWITHGFIIIWRFLSLMRASWEKSMNWFTGRVKCIRCWQGLCEDQQNDNTYFHRQCYMQNLQYKCLPIHCGQNLPCIEPTWKGRPWNWNTVNVWQRVRVPWLSNFGAFYHAKLILLGSRISGDKGVRGYGWNCWAKVGTPHLQQVGLLRRTCFCLVCRDATLAMTNSC